MKKLLIILFFLPMLCNAQFDASMFSTNNQKLIEQAINNAFVLIQQPYQLEDTATHQRFGRYGNDTFGASRCLGVRVNDGIIFSNTVMTPWKDDDNYLKYSESHIPVLIKSSIMEFDGNTSDGSPLCADSVASVSESLIMISENKDIKGFSYTTYTVPTEGWLVWISSPNKPSEWNGTQPSLSIYKKSIDFNDKSLLYEIEAPQTNNNVWGGIFIVPEQTKIGQITFSLGGIITPTPDGKCILEVMNLSDIKGKDKASVDENELTPLVRQNTVEKSKKNKNKKK